MSQELQEEEKPQEVQVDQSFQEGFWEGADCGQLSGVRETQKYSCQIPERTVGEDCGGHEEGGGNQTETTGQIHPQQTEERQTAGEGRRHQRSQEEHSPYQSSSCRKSQTDGGPDGAEVTRRRGDGRSRG